MRQTKPVLFRVLGYNAKLTGIDERMKLRPTDTSDNRHLSRMDQKGHKNLHVINGH